MSKNKNKESSNALICKAAIFDCKTPKKVQKIITRVVILDTLSC
jgi:hypothetical protein